MKKFINNPDDLTQELLEGYAIAHSAKIKVHSDKLVIRAKPKSEDKVAIITMGGAGHEPALSGFVGSGMLDVCVVGDIFAAPGPPKVLEALSLMKRDAGIFFNVLNHAGDVMSAQMAMEMANQQNINYKMYLSAEDIASGPDTPRADRRGLVGSIPLWKIIGAAAEAGQSLDEVYAIGEKFGNNMATLAVAMNSATHPATGNELFTLADDEMEIGMGQHGESGVGPTKLLSADDTARTMIERLVKAIDAQKGDRIMVMLNGAGATTLMELFIVLRGVKKVLDEKGITIVVAECGEYLTVQEMAGFQMFAAKMDDELLSLWHAPCDTPYMTVR